MTKVVFEETVGGNVWRLHDDGHVRVFMPRGFDVVLTTKGERYGNDFGFVTHSMYAFAEKWRAEHWPRFAPLREDEFGSKCGERFTMKTARVEDGDPTVETEGGRRFMVFNWPGNWRDDTEERVLSWWLANWQRPADEWFDRETKRVRKLRDDEGVTDDGELLKFIWSGTRAVAIDSHEFGQFVWPPVMIQGGSRELAARLESWARANLPAHLAIVDGRVVEMADDEARVSLGLVSKCSHWTLPNLDSYSWAPGQRERVEKWRAGQVKPLGENEIVWSDGPRLTYTQAVNSNGVPTLNREGGRLLPWGGLLSKDTSDRAKRIFARLYKFRDDEGVDATTGKLRTMAINEARHPETGEIVRLRDIPCPGLLRAFGNTELNHCVWAGKQYNNPIPFDARCIAYRDHVLKLEKELEELKGGGEVIDIEKELKWWDANGYGGEGRRRAEVYIDELEATRKLIRELQDSCDEESSENFQLSAQLADQRARDIRMMADRLMHLRDRYTPEMAMAIASERYDRLAAIEVSAKKEVEVECE